MEIKFTHFVKVEHCAGCMFSRFGAYQPACSKTKVWCKVCTHPKAPHEFMRCTVMGVRQDCPLKEGGTVLHAKGDSGVFSAINVLGGTNERGE